MRHDVIEEIDAPPATVWRALLDIERWPGWTPTMTSVRRRGDGPLTVGSSAEVRQPRLPRNVWRVTELVPEQRFEWATTAPGVTTRADHRVEPLPGDRTRVTLTVEITGPLAPLLTALLGTLTRRYVGLEAASLKHYCETGNARQP